MNFGVSVNNVRLARITLLDLTNFDSTLLGLMSMQQLSSVISGGSISFGKTLDLGDIAVIGNIMDYIGDLGKKVPMLMQRSLLSSGGLTVGFKDTTQNEVGCLNATFQINH
jgi:hypothetical protein